MFEQISQTIEAHPVIASVLVGGVGILATVYFIKKNQGSQNSITGVPTDAAGNSLAGGFNVSPPMSNSDLSTMLQDMEQQILNWEQQFQQDHQTSGNNNGSGNNGGVNQLPGGNPDINGGWNLRHNPYDNPPPVDNNPPPPPPVNNPPPNTQPWWKAILSTNPNLNISDANTQSWYKVPANMTENAIAGFFNIGSWTDLAYNPHNAGLFGGQFLPQSYNQKGNNIIPEGTYLWITTSRIQS